ncbi:MAG: hypothetical protein ACRDZ2_09475, partial [Ilumatobacteraceae bacterium]
MTWRELFAETAARLGERPAARWMCEVASGADRLAKRIEDNTEPEREAEAGYVSRLTRTLESFHALRGLPALLPGTRAVNRRALGGFLDLTYV